MFGLPTVITTIIKMLLSTKSSITIWRYQDFSVPLKPYLRDESPETSLYKGFPFKNVRDGRFPFPISFP